MNATLHITPYRGPGPQHLETGYKCKILTLTKPVTELVKIYVPHHDSTRIIPVSELSPPHHFLLIADEDGVEVPHSILRYHVSGQILPAPMLYITDTPDAADRFSRQHLLPASLCRPHSAV